jgi:mono/diheme cytochrome c family protein
VQAGVKSAAALAAVAAAAAAVSAAGAATPVERGKALYGQYCVACHGANGSGVTQTRTKRIGGGPLRLQTQQVGVAPPLRGVGAMSADFYLRTGRMPLGAPDQRPQHQDPFFADADIQALVRELDVSDGELAPLLRWSPSNAKALKERRFDPDQLASRRLGYQRLDQLVFDLLTGAR